MSRLINFILGMVPGNPNCYVCGHERKAHSRNGCLYCNCPVKFTDL